MAAVGRRVAWVGVALGVAYLIFIGGGWWGIYASSLRLLTVLIAGGTLAIWLSVAVRNPAWRPRTLMWPAIIACLGSLALSTAFSAQPRVSVEYLAYAVVLAALYLLLVKLFADPFFRPRLLALFTMLFGAVAVLYVGSVLVGWIEWWRLAGLTLPPLRPGFEGLTFGNPSAALTMVALLAVPVAAMYGVASRRGAVVLVGLALVIASVAAMSGSRAGWFALGVTFLVGIGTVFGAPTLRRPAIGWIRSEIRSQPAVLWLPVVILLVEAVIVAPAIAQRVFAGGESARLTFAAAAIRMFGTSPLVGTGPGTWVIQRPAVVDVGEPDEFAPHAHNVEVQTLAELGLVGAFAGIVLLASVLRILRLGVRSGDPERRRWSWFAAAGLGYFFLHNLLDFYANMPAFLFVASIPIAYLDGRTPGAHGMLAQRFGRLSVAARRLGTGFAVGLIAVCVVGLTVQEIPALRHDRAVAAVDDHNWPAAVSPAREAAALDPTIAPYQLTAGLVASASGDHQGAAAAFERVVAQSDLPEAWLDLAVEHVALADTTTAGEAIARALRLGEGRPQIAVAAGDLAFRIGDQATAVKAFGAAIAARPSLAGDPWWRADVARTELYPQVIASAMVRNPAGAWEIEMMAGQAASPVDDLPRRIAAAWNGDSTAVQNLTASCSADPMNVDLLSWCARVLRHLGDDERAAAYTERVGLISLGAAESTFELRVTQDGAAGFDLAPPLWGTYTYRRTTPRDILVGSLVHLHLE